MQRCTGPCRRLLRVNLFPRDAFGLCLDCLRGEKPLSLGEDRPLAVPAPSAPRARPYRSRGF
jgi:hypothetical protein